MVKIRPITLKRALTDCYKIWTWLADHPDKDKEDNPLIKRVGYVNDCPMCQYVEGKHGASTASGWIMRSEKRVITSNACLDCPLLKLWPNGCMDEDSPYDKWCMLQDDLKCGDLTPKEEGKVLALVRINALKIANAVRTRAAKEGITLG